MLATERLRSLPIETLRLFGAEVGPVDFASDEHRQFFESHTVEIVASGWMGAGKSRILCEKAWYLAKRYPGATFALFRKVAASLPATTMRTFQRDVMQPDWIASRNKTENWYELTNGSRIYFLGLDPDPITGVPSKVGSLDLAWAGVDEAVELTESDWIMLLGRLRDPRMPWHQLAAATNPGPPAHWLRRRMTDGSSDHAMVTIRRNKFLHADYLALLADLPDTPQGRRLGKGEWAGAEGLIWTLPVEQIRPPDTQEFKRKVGGVDWGFVHAFACEVIGQTGSGRMAVVDEIYERGETIDQIIPILRLLQDKAGVEMFYADPSEPAYILQCQRAGIRITEANNAVAPGIGAVAMAIKAGMTVAPSCKGLLGEIPSYVWQQNRLGLTEKPIEINDDACDALRYGVVALTPSLDENPWTMLAGQRVGGVA